MSTGFGRALPLPLTRTHQHTHGQTPLNTHTHCGAVGPVLAAAAWVSCLLRNHSLMFAACAQVHKAPPALLVRHPSFTTALVVSSVHWSPANGALLGLDCHHQRPRPLRQRHRTRQWCDDSRQKHSYCSYHNHHCSVRSGRWSFSCAAEQELGESQLSFVEATPSNRYTIPVSDTITVTRNTNYVVGLCASPSGVDAFDNNGAAAGWFLVLPLQGGSC